MIDAPVPGSPACPRIAADLPLLGGEIRAPEDFVVDEVPAYAPSGEGEHWFVRVRKRGLSTPVVQRMLAEAAGVSAREVGYAGRKDRDAVTTQWFSLPAEPVALDDERVELLERARHGHKLRLAHLKGNRFTLTLHGVERPEALAALLERIGPGVPNYYGGQRFARGGLEKALALLRAPKQRVRDPKFLASVAQSAVFNLWLGARVGRGELHRAVLGDVLAKRATGGLFICEDVGVDDPRVVAGEVDATGPMPGRKMKRAAGPAAAYELDACRTLGIERAAFDGLGKLANGTRRIARLIAEELAAEAEGDTVRLSFFLRRGAYATTVLAELGASTAAASRST